MTKFPYLRIDPRRRNLTLMAARDISSLRFLLVTVMTAAMLPGIGLAPSVAEEAGPTTRRLQVEFVEADFILATKKIGHYKWFVVKAARYTNTDTGRVWTKGSASRGTCEGDSTGLNTACDGERVNGWRVTHFEADNRMKAALVRLKKPDRRPIWVRFDGDGRYSTDDSTYQNACGGTTTDVYRVSRGAWENGRVFGRRVSTRTEAEGNRAQGRMHIIDRTEVCP